MSEKKLRQIVFTNDLDGVHFYGPPPWPTLKRLWKKNFVLSEAGLPVGEYVRGTSWSAVLYQKLSYFFHYIRPLKKDTLTSLAQFKSIAQIHNRTLLFAVLSGREKDKHEMTKRRLLESGYMEYFTKLYLNLNEGKYADRWKESVVRDLVQKDFNVVHIDDDLWAGLSVARVQEEFPNEKRVYVYILKNVSNNDYLLKRANVVIPENLVFMKNFEEAIKDFESKLQENLI